MSLRDIRRHIGQLAIAGFAGESIPADLKSIAREFDLGGIILFARNVSAPEQVAEIALLAAEAVRGFVSFALSDANVRAVVAHTLAEKNASNSVLARVGFKCVAELANDEVGRVWRWALAR